VNLGEFGQRVHN